MQDAYGQKIRDFINTLTHNRFRAVLTGGISTISIQSSTIISVITVGFVDTGLIKLRQAAGVLIGANIGTTLTAWIIAFFGIKYGDYMHFSALPLMLIAVPLQFSKNIHFRRYGYALAGLVLIILSLSYITHNINDSYINNWISNNNQVTILNIFLYFIIGVLISAIVHNSAVVTLLAILIVSQNHFSLPLVASLVIGANVGTTFTALLASFIGNTEAKRTAFFHTGFNLLGAIMFMPFIVYITDFIHQFVPKVEFFVAFFHTFFNIFTAIIISIFLDPILKFIQSIIKDNKEVKRDNLQHLDSFVMVSSSIHLIKANVETIRFGSIIVKIISKLGSLITETDSDKFYKNVDIIIQYEQESDMLEYKIRKFLFDIDQTEISPEGSKKLKQLSTIIHNLENISDLAAKLAMVHRERKEHNAYFKPKSRTAIIQMQELIEKATQLMLQNINEANIRNINMDEVNSIENDINNLYRVTMREFYIYLEEEKGLMNPLTAVFFKEIMDAYENIGDFLHKTSKELVR